VNGLSKASFLPAALAAALIVSAPAAEAQYFSPADSGMMLVTPDGRILEGVPDNGDYVMARDRRGRRVLIDRYGTVLATEMRARNYYPRPPVRDANNDGYGNQGGRRYGDTQLAEGDGYGGYGNDGYSDQGAVTGAIPRAGSVVRVPFDNQAMPPADADNNGGGGGDSFASIDPDASAIENATPDEPVITLKNKSKNEITALQVFLDRQGVSPGAIDGRMGGNVTKAVYAYQKMTGQTFDPNDTDAILEQLRLSGGMPIINYTITPADAAGPYVAEIPEDYAQKATLTSLAYNSTTEMLAERFHMDEAYLKSINPGADFTVPGTIVKVINPGQTKTGSVARIVADKGRKQVFAYDANGGLIAAYPASIGSNDTPSPSGTVTVERVAFNPGYTYNPKINFQQGGNDRILDIPPGPNGPVGTVWMALSKPTYGIHGTPDPSRIGKSQSHGCVRLTNWDATELAKMVKPGVTVEFVD
jgi:lipoprotein-anchoring transpeptidase ErfK/SrfK